MGLKHIAELAVGDWILLESIILSRHVSQPWEVLEINRTRVKLRRGDLEDPDYKNIYSKSIRFIFDTEQEALSAFEFARANSEVYEKAAVELRKHHEQVFRNHMISIPTTRNKP